MSKFFKDENGQGMIEYALIVGVIAAVAIVVLIAIRNKATSKLEDMNNSLNDPTD